MELLKHAAFEKSRPWGFGGRFPGFANFKGLFVDLLALLI